jgi:hypothetical protein
VTRKERCVGYNVQSVVDETYKIPIDYEVTNKHDGAALGAMLERSLAVLKLSKKEKKGLIALFDTGYYSGEALSKAHNLGVDVLVAIPKLQKSNQAPNPAYNLSNFIYDKVTDTYVCPAGAVLKTNGNWITQRNCKVKVYRTKSCKGCPFRADCTKAKQNGRIIMRNEYAEHYEQHKKRMAANPTLYLQRQAIVEHPFGTLKRSWGYTYIMTKKGINRAKADVGFMFLGYNLCRLFNILDFDTLNKYFSSLKKHIFIRLTAKLFLVAHKSIVSYFFYQKMR